MVADESVPRTHSRNEATTPTARRMSSALFARPIDARTAPTAVLLHAAKRSGVKPSPRESKQAAMRGASRPKAASDAPGLQKHPPRRDTPARRARASTSEYV